jgi:hypothetical protein
MASHFKRKKKRKLSAYFDFFGSSSTISWILGVSAATAVAFVASLLSFVASWRADMRPGAALKGLARSPSAFRPSSQICSYLIQLSFSSTERSEFGTHLDFGIVVQRLERHDTLQEQRLGIAKLQVHDTHDYKTDPEAWPLLADLLEVIVSVCGNCRLARCWVL